MGMRRRRLNVIVDRGVVNPFVSVSIKRDFFTATLSFVVALNLRIYYKVYSVCVFFSLRRAFFNFVAHGMWKKLKSREGNFLLEGSSFSGWRRRKRVLYRCRELVKKKRNGTALRESRARENSRASFYFLVVPRWTILEFHPHPSSSSIRVRARRVSDLFGKIEKYARDGEFSTLKFTRGASNLRLIL